jgi:CRP-like cAMP-binding protein
MTRAEIERTIECAEYFRGLSPESRKLLAQVCSPVAVQKGEHLFFEGQKGKSVFLLVSGAIQLVKTSDDGREVVIRTVRPGELFAEVILFEKDSYPATAMAVGASTLCSLPRSEFLRLLEDRKFRTDFIASLMGRMRYLADRVLYLTVYEVEERFFRFIEEHFGRQDQYSVTLSKKAFAAAIGATPETFSRLLDRLKRERKIAWRSRTVSLARGFWDRWDKRGG